jgi:uncharacterized protein
MNRIAVFARRPELGRAKTRLSPALPPEAALDLYRGMLADAIAAAANAGCDERRIVWADPASPSDERFPTPVEFREGVQVGDDLGERLEAAFDELLDRPNARAVVIGADCPELEPDHFARAFAALDRQDLVVGPTLDGGYYLIGLRARSPAVFRGIKWSSSRVLDETRARANDHGLAVTMLDVLSDIDTPEDLVTLIARALRAGPSFAGRATQAALRSLGLLPTTLDR